MIKYLNKSIVKNVFFILLGSLISSLAINLFISKAKLLSGGASGISLIIQYLFKFPAGYSILLLNIPLLILSYKFLNKRFTILTFIGTISFSMFLILTAPLKGVIDTTDTLLLCLYGGALNGIGIGIVFSNHGSAGGLNIISALIKVKHDNYKIGQISFYINIIIVVIATFFFGVTSALYTIVAMFITAEVTDRIIIGIGKQKLVLIITVKEKEICSGILYKMHRGVTFLYGQGGYTGKREKILFCTVPLHQIPELKLIIKEIDNDAFMITVDASEVRGKGFKSDLI
ncbi:YitT family protein [Clostridium tagluense]|uniref:YitT family protein n=1 Tax=Clostridium TaxID=1485 RepID=UPI0013E91CF1|nr:MULTISPECIES: YitT family protein [Clostridium]MBW9157255.1 YitT family protein [Clostridium tagluense]MBZ9623396.1 YitT family protein [Clostridium sp. FP2]MCB2310953.1 YitT family protein [Clostridium tagluense]MCB2315807.1 YitT family protein [Clostridium tagluense]MCB2320549.1 YitT family protein [Clostridium tagluense]